MPDLPPRRSATAAPPEKAGSSRRRVGAIVAGVLALLVVGAVLVIVLHSGGVANPPAGNEIGNVTPPPAASPPAAATSTKVNRAGTQVAVLNGTTTTGLARGVADKLEKSGFTIIKVGDNADQALSATTISYSGGNVAAARAVARIIGVGNAAVRPTDTNTSVAVGPKAKVVVLVGNDRSSTG
jgi:hypothetical protein